MFNPAAIYEHHERTQAMHRVNSYDNELTLVSHQNAVHLAIALSRGLQPEVYNIAERSPECQMTMPIRTRPDANRKQGHLVQTSHLEAESH
jgi:hypothetical protein